MEEILRQFRFDGTPVSCEPFGNGHINRTFHVRCDGGCEYTVQKINRVAFHRPEELIENIDAVTNFIAARQSPDQEIIRLVPALDGKKYYVDQTGEYWRAYSFISSGLCLDMPRSTRDFYEAAVAFGRFQMELSDFPADTLHETIPHFHDTPERFRQLRESVRRDKAGRAGEVAKELDFLFAREDEFGTLVRLQKAGELPLRVTHNDTKLNNVLLDAQTGKARCVLDLDTVMPGLSACDFGDAIRFGASTAKEDETELDKVTLDLAMYRAFLQGYLDACGAALTKKEIEVLPLGAKILTGELAARFLKDYLDGDVYFSIHRPRHNLDRTRTQLKLVADMETKWDDMQRILREVAGIS
jgi:Ser/Thr protein kinase RdoA (MazF antagonist)